METLANLLHGLPEVAQAVLVLSLVCILGLVLGDVKVKGIGLGIGGVLFAGIFVGHFGYAMGLELDPHVLEFVREFGLILFVYTIGIMVGPGFFEALRRTGLKLNLLAGALVIMGVVVAALIYLIFDLPLPVVLGLFSGGVTNTPSLGAGQQILKEVGAAPELLTLPGLGYAVAYPFGIAGILITMLVVRGLFRVDVNRAAEAFEAERQAETAQVETLDVMVRSDEAIGQPLRNISGLVGRGVVVSRMLRDGQLQVPQDDTLLRLGDVLHLVGPRDKLDGLSQVLGRQWQAPLTTKGTDLRWERLVVTDPRVLGKPIAALNLENIYGVRISRVNRAGVDLVANGALRLQLGDVVNVIGSPEDIGKVADTLGNRAARLREVHLVPVFIGIFLGLLLGSIPLFLPGMAAPMKLGLAGGPLVAAILLSRLGNVGRLVWYMPPVANTALRELGIVLFLAVVGYRSGAHFVETLVSGDGLLWMLLGAMITLIPLMAAGLFGYLVLRLNYLTLCGVLAGSMTDPPALAFANSLSTTQAASLAYATVYPLVMCLRILAPQVLVLLLWAGSGG